MGEARRVPAERLAPVLTDDSRATLDYWWLHLPGTGMLIAHAGSEPTDVDSARSLHVVLPSPGEPAMDTFALGLITLANLPGVPPARRRWPWVTHELMVHTIDCSAGPVPFEAPFPWRFMQPHNLSVQFQVDDDDQARHLVHDLAKAIVHGVVPPEVQAYVPERRKMMTLLPLHNLWQDTVDATAAHLRGEHDGARR